MKVLKIKDNNLNKKDDFSEIRTVTGRIVDKTLEQLEREGVFVFPEIVKDAEDITRDQMILQSVNDSYRSGNVMGFLGCGDERLIIESRFSGNREDYFFQYLLDRVLEFPNIVDLNVDADQNNRLFNFLLFLFPYYLERAMRKGLFKNYIRHRYNDGNVKGADIRLIASASRTSSSNDANISSLSSAFSSTKRNLRRIAKSKLSTDLSISFIVPMIYTFSGMKNLSLGSECRLEYCVEISPALPL